MYQTKINKLTKEQEAEIPYQIERWMNIAHKPIDKTLAKECVVQLYSRIEESAPPVVFAQSPFQATLMVLVCRKLFEPLSEEKRGQLWDQLGGQLGGQLWGQLGEINKNWYMLLGWIETYAGWIEFGKKIGVKFDPELYHLFLLCAEHLPFIIPYKGICFVSDKPTEIHWRNRRLHKDGGMSVKFSDGYGMYNFDGVQVPAEWGSIPSEQWKPEWLLKEKNAELRRVLIQGLGYGRIMKSLNAKNLDSWREYDLMKISESVDVEPIVLVSMRCPSTGLIHVHRVAPHIKTAREAITSINQGIDPESFEVET